MSIRITVRAKPGASRTRVGGSYGSEAALVVAVTARAVDGKANEELRVLVAEHLGVRRAQVVIKSGAGGRLKLVQIHPA